MAGVRHLSLMLDMIIYLMRVGNQCALPGSPGVILLMCKSSAKKFPVVSDRTMRNSTGNRK